MGSYNNVVRIGNFWDYPIEFVNEKTNPGLIKLILCREKIWRKVENNEWTEADYDSFSKIIKKTHLDIFVNFFDIVDFFINLDKEELIKVVENLINNDVIRDINLDESIICITANVIIKLQAKIMSIVLLSLSEEAKKSEDLIKVYEDLLIDLDNPNSEHQIIFNSAFSDYINSNVQNNELKEIILNYSQKIPELKKMKIHNRLKGLYVKRAKTTPIYKYVLNNSIDTNDRKALRNKK